MASKSSSEGAKPGATSKSSKAQPKAGATRKMFSKFEILKKIGSGGMGAVYLAQDTELHRELALKILPKEKASNPTLLKRFKSEAQAAANLKHDNIVMVYGAGEHEGYYFMTMEYVEGIDVHRLIGKKEKLSVKRSIEIIKQIASALDHISHKGIVHRDIKPSNLFIQKDGTVKLGDLGLARSLEESEEAGVTRDGTTVGTVDYISPEQARNSKSADIRSDMYSLGCTWYHMLTGVPPFPDGSLTNKLHAHAVKPPPDPRDINKNVPEGVVAILQRMMAKKAEDRYQTPAELISDLERSMLSRKDIADTVLASLEVEDTDEEDTSPAEFSSLGEKNFEPSAIRPAIPKRLDEKANEEKDDSFKFNVDIVKFILVGGFSFVVAGGLIYGAMHLYNSWGTEESSAAANQLRQNQIERERRANDPNWNKGDSSTETPNENNEDTTTEEDGTVVAYSKNDSKSEKNSKRVIHKEFFPELNEEERLNLQTSIWLNKYYLSKEQPDLKTMQVQRSSERSARKNSYSTVNSAYKNAQNKGAVLEISGDLPIVLQPIRLVPNQHLILRGELSKEGVRPVLIVNHEENSPIFEINRAQLVIENIDILVMPTFGKGKQVKSLFNLREGELCLKHSSVTVMGESSVIGIQVEGSEKATNHLVVDHTVMRGNQLTMIDDVSALSEVIGVKSLLANRSKSLFHLSPVSVEQVSEAATNRKKKQEAPPSNLQLIQCTLSSGTSVFNFPAPNKRAYRLRTRNTLFASSASTAVFIESKPVIAAVTDKVVTKSETFSIRWSDIGSRLSGWGPLIRSELASIDSPKMVDEWNEFWGHEFTASQLTSDLWPENSEESLRAISEFQNVKLGDNSTFSGGIEPAELNAPSNNALHEICASIWKTQFSAQQKLVVPTGSTIEYTLPDQMKDFVTRLSSGEWGEKTQFVLKGSGASEQIYDIPLPPVAVIGNTLSIEFRPNRSNQIAVIRPRATTADSSLITVENGNLRLSNIHVDARTTRSGDYPSSLIEVTNGSFVIDHCMIQSSFQRKKDLKDSHIKSLIRWNENETGEPALRSGHVLDSFVYGATPILHSSVEQSNLQFQNSCLISASVVVQQDILETHKTPKSFNYWKSCSLSTWESFYQLSNNRKTPPAEDDFQFAFFNMYFGPAFEESTRKPHLIEYQGIREEQPLFDLTTHYVGKSNQVEPTMWSVTSSDAPSSEEGKLRDDTVHLTGIKNRLLGGSTAAINLPLVDPLPKKFPTFATPLYLRLDPSVSGADPKQGLLYGAELRMLPSITGGQKRRYQKKPSRKDGGNRSPKDSNKLQI